jgi:hypothetical protein
LEMQQAFKLHTEGQHFNARISGTTYNDVLISELHVASDGTATMTLVLPTPVGQPTRFGTWRVDQVEVVA